MTEGPDQSQDTAELLRGELEELERQHEQYTLALDAAMDPRTSLRLQRTLERLDDEIAGLREALSGYEQPAQEQPHAGIHVPDSGRAVLPEWEEDEEEPATNIYSGQLPEGLGLPGDPGLSTGGGARRVQVPADPVDPPTVAFERRSAPSGAVEQPAMYGDSVPTDRQPRRTPSDVDTARVTDGAHRDLRHADEPPTMTVSPPLEQRPLPGKQLEDLVTDVATPSGAAITGIPRPPMERPAAPPGGASFSSLPPPSTFEEPTWGRTEIVPPSYDTMQRSLPSAPTPAQSPLDSSGGSPFGGTPGPTPGSPSGLGDYGYASEPIIEDRGEWSLGSRLLLGLLVLLFLGGVGWILSQGP
jgi:hypothetical protein